MDVRAVESQGGLPESCSGPLTRALEELLVNPRDRALPGRFLRGLAGALGAHRLVWIEDQARFDSRVERAEEAGSTDNGLDLSLISDLGVGEVRLPSSERLLRSAQFRRGGGGHLTLCGGSEVGALDGQAAALWIESTDRLAHSAESLRWVVRSVECVLALAAKLGGVGVDEALKQRGVAALAMVHDLRHQISLASLSALRAREEEGEAGASSARELERALEKAREISQAALSDSSQSNRANGSLRLHDLLREEAQAVGRLGKTGGRNGGKVAIALRCPQSLKVTSVEASLSRLVRNLLLNAYKASSAGGRVLVSAAAPASDGERVVLTIEDQGKGMSPEQVRRLFTSDQTRAGGAGCGTLSILACVEELNAELEVESEPGQGTRVRLYLSPGVEADATRSEVEVLLIDGHPHRARQRLAQLKAQGARVRKSRNVAEALTELERIAPRRILVERGLPQAELKRLASQASARSIELATLDYRGEVTLADLS